MRMPTLTLTNLDLADLPDTFLDMPYLLQLDLEGNRLTSLPKTVASLQNLETLNISGNLFRSLPPALSKLKHLKSIYAGECRIESFPRGINSYSSLRLLDLSSNNIKQIKISSGSLTRLTQLDCSGNIVDRVDSSLGTLRNIRFLFLGNNQIASLPHEFSNLTELESLDLVGNPLLPSIRAAYSDGIWTLLRYLKSLAGKSVPLREVKLVLVGEGAVGKSSLLASMAGESFNPLRSTTHGIEIKNLALPHSDGTTKITVHCWDFGGQPTYRIGHQFFYTDRSVFLLVWNPRLGAEACDVEGWIRRIRLRTGDGARIIVVSTHSETEHRLPRIDKKDLREKYGTTIVDFVEADSRTLSGIDPLKAIIAATASGFPHMNESVAISWQNARTAILGLSDPYIKESTFLSICKQNGMEREQSVTLARLMHILGDLLYFADSPGLSDLMVLKPEWLTKAIGFVLEDRDTNESAGVLQHKDLKRIWGTGVPIGEKPYPRNLHPFFLRLMEKFDVSYRLEGIDASLVAELVPQQRPELPWTLASPLGPAQSELILCYSLMEVPPGLIAWITVRTHLFSYKPRLQWTRGVFLSYGEHGEALIYLDNNKNGHELIVCVRALWPNYFLQNLRFIVDRLLETRWPGLEYTRSVPCQRGSIQQRCYGRFPQNTLERWRAGQVNLVPCTRCSEVNRVDDLLSGVSFSGVSSVDEHQNSGPPGGSRMQAWFETLLRALNSDHRDAPRLFSLQRVDSSVLGKLLLSGGHMRLNLWCEMPGQIHPVCRIGTCKKVRDSGQQGEYLFSDESKILSAITPYAGMIVKVLKLMVPVAGAASDALLTEDAYKEVLKSLSDMEGLVAALPAERGITSIDTGELASPRLTSASGSALRAFHHALRTLDKRQHWGGLQRVITPSGQYLWLCPDHFKQFEPDMPEF